MLSCYIPHPRSNRHPTPAPSLVSWQSSVRVVDLNMIFTYNTVDCKPIETGCRSIPEQAQGDRQISFVRAWCFRAHSLRGVNWLFTVCIRTLCPYLVGSRKQKFERFRSHRCPSSDRHDLSTKKYFRRGRLCFTNTPGVYSLQWYIWNRKKTPTIRNVNI